jgi:tRNA A-37 threonylcarbamoyl transferase component Bud32
VRFESVLIQQGVSLALEAHRRGFLDDRSLDVILAYYDQEGSREPAAVEDVLARLGGLSDEQILAVKAPPSKTPASKRPPELAGQRFNDRLTLLELLGEGGMGSVYRAFDRVLKRVVAVKRVRTDRIAGGDLPRVLARFEREAQAMARVRHPACVAVYDAGLVDGEPYLVMDFVPGRSLAAVIEEGQVDPRQVAEWGRALAEALQACHDVGVVHRDVKPANILVDPQGKVHLTDFGVALDARAQTKLTVDRGAVGTLCYMPPEQVLGSGTDARSDVYALGATLYEALAGRPPFDAELAVMLLRQVVEDEPARLRSVVPDVDDDLETIIQTCLAKDKAERYATAQALALDLARYASNEPIMARPSSTVGRLARRAWRVRRRIGVGLSLSVTLAGVFIASAYRERERARSDALGVIEAALIASDLSAAEDDLLPVIASSTGEIRERAQASLRSIRSRRAVERASAAFRRALEASEELRALNGRLMTLVSMIDLGAPLSDCPPKAQSIEVEARIRHAERRVADALNESRLLLAQAAVDGESVAHRELEARILIFEARAMEDTDPMAAEDRYDLLSERNDPSIAGELVRPALSISSRSEGGIFFLSVFRLDPRIGAMRPLVVHSGRLPVRFSAIQPGDYLLEAAIPNCLPWRSPLRLRRGDRRSVSIDAVRLENLGPLQAHVTFIPEGEARWGVRLDQRTACPAFLISTRECRIEEWWSFVMATQATQRPQGASTLEGLLTHPNRMRVHAFGISATEVEDYFRWLSAELRLAGLAYEARMPSHIELHRAVRGELGWPFPWGDRADAALCNNSHSTGTNLVFNDAFAETDRSPFGVEGLAGSASELAKGPAGYLMLGGNMTTHVTSLHAVLTQHVLVDDDAKMPWIGFRYVLSPLQSDSTTRQYASSDELNAQARELDTKGDLIGASRLYTRSLESDSTRVDTWTARASVRCKQEDYWGAVWDYTVALRLAPDHMLALGRRGLAQSRRGALAAATEDLTVALDRSGPRAPSAWRLERGLCRAKLGDLGAVADFETWLSREPNDPRVSDVRGWIAELQRQAR